MTHPATDYAGELFRKVRLERGELAGSQFHDCTFEACSFAETSFESCRFVGCLFRDCDLSLAQIRDCSFTTARFEQSKLVGVDWTRASWPEVRLGEPLSFTACALSHSTFIGLNLQGVSFRGCVAVNVDFREADLSAANFARTDLLDSLFQATNLTGADLSRARNYRIDPSQNRIEKARFSLPEAMSLLYSMDIVLVEE